MNDLDLYRILKLEPRLTYELANTILLSDKNE